jgi:hypothetical protein
MMAAWGASLVGTSAIRSSSTAQLAAMASIDQVYTALTDRTKFPAAA